jgi:hypothetical protein
MMVDPITLIVTALVAGAAAGAKDSASTGVKDAYAVLRDAVRRRLAGHSPKEGAVIAEWDSDPSAVRDRRGQLVEALTMAGAGESEELVTAARRVMELVDPQALGAARYAGSSKLTGLGPRVVDVA